MRHETHVETKIRKWTHVSRRDRPEVENKQRGRKLLLAPAKLLLLGTSLFLLTMIIIIISITGTAAANF